MDEPNLAAPAYEPTDEEFARLMQASFAGLDDPREESLRVMRARIAALTAEARVNPALRVIAGPNEAGKTTVTSRLST